MNFLFFVLYFFGGVFFVNVVLYFVSGLCGELF